MGEARDPFMHRRASVYLHEIRAARFVKIETDETVPHGQARATIDGDVLWLYCPASSRDAIQGTVDRARRRFTSAGHTRVGCDGRVNERGSGGHQINGDTARTEPAASPEES